jgi:hypothetical protein
MSIHLRRRRGLKLILKHGASAAENYYAALILLVQRVM